MCSSLQQSCLPGKSANYNIKAVSTSDLFAFALYAITLNQERSAVDVGPMQKTVCSFILCSPFVHRSDEIQIVQTHGTSSNVSLRMWCLHSLI